MGVISWIVIGLLAGWLAAKITDAPQGLFRNIAVGLVGGVLARQLGIQVMPSFWGELLTAIVGAVILLLVLQFVRRG